jgi:spore coat protein CotH
MNYDPSHEKEKILLYLQEQNEYVLDKKQMMHNAILFAVEQFDELKLKTDQFIQHISHLDVYQHLIKDKFEKGIFQMIDHAKMFIEHNYEEEELSMLSKKELHDVIHSQKKRYELLKIIAKKHYTI